MRFLQRSLIVVGCLLIVTYGFVRGYSAGYSAAAVLQFEGANRAGGEKAASVLPQQLEEIDFSLWSESRIRSFKKILGIEVAEPIALLEIERLGVRVAVFDGTDRTSLLRGAGWIQGTTRPTEAGNIGIAAHRDGFFRLLKDIQIGDVIRLTTGQGVLQFRVDETEIVESEDTHVLQSRDDHSLTLVTCYPFYFVGPAPQRFIVHAASLNEAPALRAEATRSRVSRSWF